MKIGFRAIAVVAAMALCPLSSIPAHGSQNPERGAEVPKILRRAGGVLQGAAIKKVSPQYPEAAKAEGADGPVVVEVVVDERGSVISARPVSGHPLLTGPSTEAARGWKWNPTLLSGMPVKVIGTLTFNFNMGSEGLSEKRITALKNNVRANPKSAEAHYELAGTYFKLLRYDDAEESYGRAIKLKPDYAEAHAGLAEAYSKSGKKEESIKSYEQAISLKPTLFNAYHNLSDVYFSSGKMGPAIEILGRAVKLNPEGEEIYHRLGWLYFLTGRYEDAIGPLRKAVTINPKLAAAHFFLGQAYVRVGNKEAAMAEYETLKELKSQMAPELLSAINK
ncbi:MAG TPA: TonB family protein [Blastocatellia bacterium]|nr:TonB family protein [Blastocatellia bacterium]